MKRHKKRSEDPTPGDNHPVTLSQLRDATAAAVEQVTAIGTMIDRFASQEKERLGLE